MQIRSQVSKTVKDYQNLKKNNHFSPSPIKRYQSSKSFNFSSADNKENMGQSTIKQNNLTKRFKKPLQQLFTKMSNNNSSIIDNLNSENLNTNNIIAPLVTDFSTLEKSKSQILLPLQFQEDNQQPLLNRDLLSKIETLTQKKRMEKQERKIEESMKQAQQTATEQQDIALTDQRVHQDIQDSSRKEELSQLIKKSEKESDSLMEATEHSVGSGHAGGMQYSGRWTQEEHDKFLEGLKLFGKDWRQIEEYIGSRTCAQIRSHAQKYFNKLNREISRSQAKYEKGANKRKKMECFKKESNVQQQQQEVPQQQQQIQFQTDRQVQQIHETLQKLAEDEVVINLRQLITQREQVCLDFMTKQITAEDACKRLIIITNAFHQEAMKSLQSCKCNYFRYICSFIVDICNRMVDERNLTQFICILLSKQVTVLPSTNSQNCQEIIQHVHTTVSQDSLQQQTLVGGGIGEFQGVNFFKGTGIDENLIHSQDFQSQQQQQLETAISKVNQIIQQKSSSSGKKSDDKLKKRIQPQF